MTPLYLALEKLGARVHFFHTVTGLELEGTGPDRRLTTVHLQRQAEVKAGPAAYQPLLTEDLPNNPPNLRDWPMDPHYDQLVDGDWFKKHNIDFFDAWQTTNTRAKPVALREGADFDLVVLGVPLGALPLIESPLTSPRDPAADPAWKAMIDGIAVTQTMSFQLWFGTPAANLLSKPRGLLTAYAQPEPSYGDFTPLIAYEDWPAPKPQYCAYFTGASYSGKPPLPPQCGPDYPEKMQDAWVGLVRTWLRDNYAAFYDGPATPQKFPAFLNLLTAPGATTPRPAPRLSAHHRRRPAVQSLCAESARRHLAALRPGRERRQGPPPHRRLDPHRHELRLRRGGHQLRHARRPRDQQRTREHLAPGLLIRTLSDSTRHHPQHGRPQAHATTRRCSSTGPFVTRRAIPRIRAAEAGDALLVGRGASDLGGRRPDGDLRVLRHVHARIELSEQQRRTTDRLAPQEFLVLRRKASRDPPAHPHDRVPGGLQVMRILDVQIEHMRSSGPFVVEMRAHHGWSPGKRAINTPVLPAWDDPLENISDFRSDDLDDPRQTGDHQFLQRERGDKDPARPPPGRILIAFDDVVQESADGTARGRFDVEPKAGGAA
jgi:hypothetical protein